MICVGMEKLCDGKRIGVVVNVIWGFCIRGFSDSWVLCAFVLDKLHWRGLVGIDDIGGLERILDVTIFEGEFL